MRDVFRRKRMKKLMTKALAVLALTTTFVSCDSSNTGYYYEPTYHYNCYSVYDYWGYYVGEECYWEYYSNGELVKEKDIAEITGDIETHKIERMASFYADKFELSTEQAMKVAKNVKDFSALEDRSEEDIADFAEQLYGVNPSSIVSAVGKAQVGQNAELDALIEEASSNFNTSKENTKALIKELHGSALEANGINL
jgi:hypothetical protein